MKKKSINLLGEVIKRERERLTMSIDDLSSVKRVEDTHTKHTFLVRNDLLNRLKEHSEGNLEFMKEFINWSIESELDELEKYSQEENE